MTTLSIEQRSSSHQLALGGALAVTLKQVAARAGVSIKTVSRIVNDDAAVNPKTRAQVKLYLQSLNYVPNNAARQMRSGASTTFGLMTDVVATTPYSVDIVRGAQSALQDAQQTLLIASSDGNPEREAQLWRMFRAHRVAGVVYASMFHRSHDLGEPAFDKAIVLANCYARRDNRPSIIPDDERGGYTQAQYLLKAGHRRIGIITLIPELEATRLRAIGMRRAFAEAGVLFDEQLERRGMTGGVGGEIMVTHDVARTMLKEPNRPTAIICGNDQVAMQVYSAAASLGLSVPEHVSVIGFDDLRLISETLFPKLTTVALPYFDIGRRAVEIMNKPEASTSLSFEKQRVACPLVERNSCKTLA
jgi:LacI family transcriptional regulator